MPEIGFPELILIAIVGLLVIGPDRLPETLRTLGLWLGRMRRSFNTVKAEIEKEIGMDEVKRQLHNEAIMDEMKRIEAEVKNTANTARASLNEGINEGIEAAQPATPSIDPNVHGDVSDMIAAQDGGLNPPAQPLDSDDASAEADADANAEADDHRDHTDASAGDADRDHTDAGADDRDHTDAGSDDRDHASASGGGEGAGDEPITPDQAKSG